MHSHTLIAGLLSHLMIIFVRLPNFHGRTWRGKRGRASNLKLAHTSSMKVDNNLINLYLIRIIFSIFPRFTNLFVLSSDFFATNQQLFFNFEFLTPFHHIKKSSSNVNFIFILAFINGLNDIADQGYKSSLWNLLLLIINFFPCVYFRLLLILYWMKYIFIILNNSEFAFLCKFSCKITLAHIFVELNVRFMEYCRYSFIRNFCWFNILTVYVYVLAGLFKVPDEADE